MRYSTLHRLFFILMAVVIGGLIAAGAAAADDAASGFEQAQGEGHVTAPAPVDKATIVKKKQQWVITSIGNRYLVKHGTLIVGQNGRQVSLRELRVPCRARIVYQRDQQVRRAHRITVLSTSADARTDFTKDMPE